MELIRLFTDAELSARKDVLITALLSSAAAVGMLGLINSASEVAARHQGLPFYSLSLYLVIFAVCYQGNKISLLSAYEMMETALQRLRVRMAEKIGQARLASLDRLGRGELYTTLSEGTSQLSQTTPSLVAGLQQGLLAVACLLYIGSLSLAGFLVMVGITVLAGGLAFRFSKSLAGARAEAADHEAQMLDSLASFVDGFKELRMGYGKSTAVHQSFKKLARGNERARVRLGEPWAFATLFTNIYLFELLAILIYVLPQLVVGLDQTIVKIAAATLFIIGPIGTVVNVLPSVEQAESGLRALNALEQRLDSVAVGQKVEESATHFDSFQSLTVQNALFQYPGEEGFLCGPWSLSARAGEVVFLVGGNGSGKSTVLKLLTGLYPLASGLIEVNGARLGPADTPALGELFTTVFTDFHLFDQLYGLEEVDPEAVRALLERMGLRDKVSFAEGRFSTLSLSTGQRKRLALVVALLEDKPIYIFDEWAADQERAFRDEFYHHILKELAARKKLVIAVTHDERYLHLADRVITFEAGRIISDRREGAPA